MTEEFNADDMLGIYLYESGQLLERLQEIVLEQKDEACFDGDSINEIFRTMHTLKGSSGTMMFDDITAVAHKLEDVFFYLRESHPQKVPHLELVEYVLEVSDFITGEMDKIGNGEAADGDSGEIIAKVDKFLTKIKKDNGNAASGSEEKRNVHEEPKQFYIAPKATSNSRFFRIYLTYRPDVALANVHAYKTLHSLKEIAEDILYSPEDIISNDNSAKEILDNGFKILIQTQSTQAELKKRLQSAYELEKIEIYPCTAKEYQQEFDSVESEIRSERDSGAEGLAAKAGQGQQAAPKKELAPGDFVISSKEPGKPKKLAKDKPKKSENASFISVDVSKMDMLMDLIGELSIAESVVLQNPDLNVPGLALDNFNKAAAQVTKLMTDLQNAVMSMRMVPLTNTFQKMKRIVFDASRKLGKDIEFEMIGETTEVDKNIIERISDPLMHLVRNSVDHGIGTKEEREAAGKSEKGKITLFAKTESGKVWIGVSDNGRGLERDKIMEKARKQGLLDPERAESSYTDKEVYQFITLPGFSTNEEVTEYSGRGVGMDVVVSNLQSVGGTLEIDSIPREGSTMQLKIPLTLAIIDGVVLEVGSSSFVMETGAVKEFVSVKGDMVTRGSNGKEHVTIRGESYPVLRLGDWYHLDGYKTDVEDGMMVVVEVENKKICIFVDRLVGKQEIVVKPIPGYVRKVKGLIGCTQLGDGSIALILDAAGMIE